ERAAAEAERAADEAAEATMPAIGRERETGQREEGGSEPGGFTRVRGEVAYRYEELERRSPVSPLVLVLGVLALVAAAAILTGGFGLLGSDDDGGAAATATKKQEETEPEVAVLNGTAPEGGVGVPGTAKAASVFVEDAGWKVGAVTDAGSFTTSTVMFTDGAKSDAKQLADDLTDQLGSLDVLPITPEIEDAAKGAEIALVVGQDDQGIAG
ncbi:MAG TPA: LytR C-terminal domain-containing protein, partial [Solirubrobacterales bacterium]|nr:LytR C-terminal domain-containing protein [Solirubrobacterales bacterium]